MLHGDAQQATPLAAGDREGRCGGEAGYDRDRDEVDEESESKEAAEKDNEAGEEGEEDGVLRAVRRVAAGHQRHDGSRTDGDILLESHTTPPHWRCSKQFITRMPGEEMH